MHAEWTQALDKHPDHKPHVTMPAVLQGGMHEDGLTKTQGACAVPRAARAANPCKQDCPRALLLLRSMHMFKRSSLSLLLWAMVKRLTRLCL